jgi:hypothetical protein
MLLFRGWGAAMADTVHKALSKSSRGVGLGRRDIQNYMDGKFFPQRDLQREPNRLEFLTRLQRYLVGPSACQIFNQHPHLLRRDIRLRH